MVTDTFIVLIFLSDQYLALGLDIAIAKWVYVPHAIYGRFTSGVAYLTNGLKFFEKNTASSFFSLLCSRFGGISVKWLKMKTKKKVIIKHPTSPPPPLPRRERSPQPYTLLAGPGESAAVDHRKRLLNRRRSRHVFIVFLERPSSSTVCVRRLPATRTYARTHNAHKNTLGTHNIPVPLYKSVESNRVQSVDRSVGRLVGRPADHLQYVPGWRS